MMKWVLTLGVLVACCPTIPEPDRDLREKWEQEQQQGGGGEDPDLEDDDALSPRGNQEVSSFRRSRALIKEIFEGRQETFYCGCRYAKDKILMGSCGYKPRKNKSRARRLEIEHVVPAQVFGETTRAWREGHPTCLSSKNQPYKGRRCAEKRSKIFRYMEADLYNLQPVIGEVNGDRSNYEPAIIPGEAREYGECDVEIEDQQVEPAPSIRGDIARTYFYMNWAYPGRGIVNSDNRALLEKWDKADPIDERERERVERIAEVQGNKNPFVK